MSDSQRSFGNYINLNKTVIFYGLESTELAMLIGAFFFTVYMPIYISLVFVLIVLICLAKLHKVNKSGTPHLITAYLIKRNYDVKLIDTIGIFKHFE